MRTIVITGCSSGFGEAFALAFARRGDRVVATMRNVEAASESLRDPSLGIEIVALDVTDPAARARVIDDVVQRHGRIDALVNNAGFALKASIEDTVDAVERRLFETNYFGPVALMRQVIPIMRKQGGGRIVNVTAIGAIFATPLLASYCATKHALDAVSAAADIEARPFGIRVANVLPGQFSTAIGAKSPPPVVTEPYRALAESMDRHRAARASDMQTDLGQVVDAVIAAVTDPSPQTRYLAGIGIAQELEVSIAELERLQQFDVMRAGV
jgi:NAD(P)-dependent dehydrogenase (short-subunit alcohol dehydrogenase family)